MRLTLIILTLALTLANGLAVAQAGADIVSGEHHSTALADHGQHQESSHHDGLLTHHCCHHGHAHIFVPLQVNLSFDQGQVPWTKLGKVSARLIHRTPPVPPPKV